MTENVTVTQKSQTIYETHVAYWLALIHYSACSSSLQSELQITHANTTTIARIKNVIFINFAEFFTPTTKI